MHKFIVLISGRGSNLQAICEAGLTPYISCVISNNAKALGLEYAKQLGIHTEIINHQEFNSRQEFEMVLAQTLDTFSCDLIVLAGFMRILSHWFINKYTNKIINIHPSLLPSFTGINAQTQAFNSKVKISGATVHYVTAELDHGPIIAQGIVGIKSLDTIDTVTNKILDLEHVIYPFIIKKILNNLVNVKNNCVYTENLDTDRTELGKFNCSIFF